MKRARESAVVDLVSDDVVDDDEPPEKRRRTDDADIESIEESSDDALARQAAEAAERERLVRVAQRRARLVLYQTLTMDQRRALALVLDGRRSVYIMGSAGTGKSHLLRALILHMDAMHTAITASTGIAATHIGGTTIHSFLGIGWAKDDAHVLARKVGRSPETCARIRSISRLVIEEISMIAPEFLDKVDHVLRVVRGRPHLPFGGVQLVACGDFLQLPPIPEPKDAPIRFAFESRAWRELAPMIVELHGSFRQHGDPLFLKLLNEVRLGVCSDETDALLRARIRSPTRVARTSTTATDTSTTPGADIAEGPTPGSDPRDDDDEAVLTYLYPHNANVDAENMAQLRKLAARAGHVQTYTATDTIHAHDPTRRKAYQDQLDKLRVPSQLSLCVGAQVMLLQNWNVTAGLANGTQGRVVGWGLAPDHWPRVCFELPDGSHRTIVVDRRNFSLQMRGKVLAERDQVPLMLSWALTGHKSQGFTMTGRVVMDLGRRIFAEGQAYVMLSRLTRLDNLVLTAFDRASIRANPRALAWLRQVSDAPMEAEWI